MRQNRVVSPARRVGVFMLVVIAGCASEELVVSAEVGKDRVAE